MSGTVKVDAVYKVRCSCGAESAIQVGTFGRPLRCPSCSGSYKVVWGLDSKTRRKVPVTINPDAGARAVFKIPPGAQELVCPCGQHLLAKPQQVGKKVQCPVCGEWMRLERYQDPQTLETRIRRIDPKARSADPAAPPAASGKPAPKVEPTQDILCTCGESLRVSPEHLGKQAQCPACGALMRLEKKQDPDTARTVLTPRILRQAQPPGKRGVDEEWSLEDFT